MTLTASSLKMKIKQTTKAFQISGMESGDYVASVVSGNSKLLKVSSYTRDSAVTLKAQKKTGKTETYSDSGWWGSKNCECYHPEGNGENHQNFRCTEENYLKEREKQTLAPILAPITTQQKVTYTTSNKKVCTVTKVV